MKPGVGLFCFLCALKSRDGLRTCLLPGTGVVASLPALGVQTHQASAHQRIYKPRPCDTPTPPFVHSLFLGGRPLSMRTRELPVWSLEDVHREQNTESGWLHGRRAGPPAGAHLHLCPNPSHHQLHLAEGGGSEGPCAPHKVKAEHLGLPSGVLCSLGSHLLGCLQSRHSVCPPGVQTRVADVSNCKVCLADKNPVLPEPGARS